MTRSWQSSPSRTTSPPWTSSSSALVPAIEATSGPPRPPSVALSWDVQPVYAMSPRAAFFSAHESVPADLAVGRVSAELIAPYPPGIPVLAPGELVTEALLAGLRASPPTGTGRLRVRPDPVEARGRPSLTQQVTAVAEHLIRLRAGAPCPVHCRRTSSRRHAAVHVDAARATALRRG